MNKKILAMLLAAPLMLGSVFAADLGAVGVHAGAGNAAGMPLIDLDIAAVDAVRVAVVLHPEKFAVAFDLLAAGSHTADKALEDLDGVFGMPFAAVGKNYGKVVQAAYNIYLLNDLHGDDEAQDAQIAARRKALADAHGGAAKWNLIVAEMDKIVAKDPDLAGDRAKITKQDVIKELLVNFVPDFVKDFAGKPMTAAVAAEILDIMVASKNVRAEELAAELAKVIATADKEKGEAAVAAAAAVAAVQGKLDKALHDLQQAKDDAAAALAAQHAQLVKAVNDAHGANVENAEQALAHIAKLKGAPLKGKQLDAQPDANADVVEYDRFGRPVKKAPVQAAGNADEVVAAAKKAKEEAAAAALKAAPLKGKQLDAQPEANADVVEYDRFGRPVKKAPVQAAGNAEEVAAAAKKAKEEAAAAALKAAKLKDKQPDAQHEANADVVEYDRFGRPVAKKAPVQAAGNAEELAAAAKKAKEEAAAAALKAAKLKDKQPDAGADSDSDSAPVEYDRFGRPVAKKK